MKIIVVCLTLFVSTLVYSGQSYTLIGNVREMAGKEIELLDFYGNKNSVVESCIADNKGVFKFRLGKELPTGLYRLKFDKTKFIDIVYNHEDIYFTLKPPDPKSEVYYLADNIEISQSDENKLYYGYLKHVEYNQRKLNLLKELYTLYKQANRHFPLTNANATFYNQIKKEIRNIQESKDGYVKQLASNYPQTFAAKLVKAFQNPIPKKEMSSEKKKHYIKEHFFDMVDFDEVSLLHSNIIPTKIRAYFTLYRNSAFSKEQQEIEFIKAVDAVMEEAEINDTMYNFVLDIITRMFEKSNYEMTFTYVTENYVLADSCKNNDSEFDNFERVDRANKLKDKIERIKKLAIGKIAPEIIMKRSGAYQQKLSDIKADYTLLFFWASWCQHCSTMLPELKEIYDDYKDKGLEIVAISIDNDKNAWMEVVTRGKYRWINYSDLMGWNSKAAIDYNVWATPKMYLLNKKKEIIAKPLNVEELKGIIIPRLLSNSE